MNNINVKINIDLLLINCNSRILNLHNNGYVFSYEVKDLQTKYNNLMSINPLLPESDYNIMYNKYLELNGDIFKLENISDERKLFCLKFMVSFGIFAGLCIFM